MITEQEARRAVLQTGLQLVEQKLIARTWGNVSCRISADEFIITPSGRSYDTLREEDLVKVSISDGSWEGALPPSTEKVLHSGVYARRTDVDFIVHTHQPYATAISVSGEDFPFAVCAKYAMPGSGELAENVFASMRSRPELNVFLMERHGVLTFGKSGPEALELALQLEQKAHEVFQERRREVSEHMAKRPFLDDYAQLFGYSGKAVDADEEACRLVREKNRLAAEFSPNGKALPLGEVLRQRRFYKRKYAGRRK